MPRLPRLLPRAFVQGGFHDAANACLEQLQLGHIHAKAFIEDKSSVGFQMLCVQYGTTRLISMGAEPSQYSPKTQACLIFQFRAYASDSLALTNRSDQMSFYTSLSTSLHSRAQNPKYIIQLPQLSEMGHQPIYHATPSRCRCLYRDPAFS